MMYRFTDYLFIILAVFFGLSFLIIFGVMSDRIDINFYNDYEVEYNECQEELERTIPICPACECKSSFPFVVLIFGFLLGIGTQEVYLYIQKLKNKLKGKKK